MSIFSKIKQILWPSPQAMMEAARQHQYPREHMQEPKRQTYYTYHQGPMYYLGQKIIKGMQDAGYPAKIICAYRSPVEQMELYAKGRTAPGKIVTKAKAWQSAHQLWEAVDIIHPSKGWNVSKDYWDTLAAVVRTVAQQHDVELEHGHNWRFVDSAHIEIKDWRQWRDGLIRRKWGVMRPLTPVELWERFHQVLPDIAKRYERNRWPGRETGAPDAVQDYIANEMAQHPFN